MLSPLLSPLLLLLLVGASGAIVLPATGAGDQPLAIVIVQGAFVYPEQYRTLGEALQNASSSPLWVGIAEGFLDNLPNPLQINSAIKETLSELHEAGMPEAGVDVFVAAHSLGGVFLPTYVKSHTDSVRGTLMFASYLTGGDTLANFPTPVLHLSGTLDGQTRATRIASTYAELDALPEDAILNTPVVLLEAVDHAHFFTGEVPPSVAENDVRSELDGDAARKMLASHSVAFMEVVRAGPDAALGAELLQAAHNTTGEFLAPLYAAQTREADADGGSAAAAAAQLQLVNVQDDSLQLQVASVHEPDLSTLEHQHPAVNVTGAAAATITVYSSVELPANPADISTPPQTSAELAVKMVSQELVAKDLPDGTFGTASSCSDINQQTMAAALEMAPQTAQERFQRRGLPVSYLEDHEVGAGPLWVQERLRLNYSEAGLSVQSVAILTSVDGLIYPGSHYCKLLTPSRALEYVLIDSLRGTEP